MSTEQCITTNIFKYILNCSFSYSHTIISWRTTAKFIYNNEWRRRCLFQNSMSFLELDIKCWFSWNLVNNYLLWFYQRIRFYKISDQIRLFDTFHKANNYRFGLKLQVNTFASIKWIFRPYLDLSTAKIFLHLS